MVLIFIFSKRKIILLDRMREVKILFLPSKWGIQFIQALQMMLMVKNPPANTGDIRDVDSVPGWGRSHGGEHGNHSSPVFLPGKSHGQKSLVDYNP